jgi:hypothetical protein
MREIHHCLKSPNDLLTLEHPRRALGKLPESSLAFASRSAFRMRMPCQGSVDFPCFINLLVASAPRRI